MEISKTHRVRFLVETLDHKECDGLTSSEIFWKIADKFKETEEARWVDDNNITLKMLQEETDQIWVKHPISNVAVIYGDLTAQEYMAYSLKFFKHKQEWK
mgnify:FL=1